MCRRCSPRRDKTKTKTKNLNQFVLSCSNRVSIISLSKLPWLILVMWSSPGQSVLKWGHFGEAFALLMERGKCSSVALALSPTFGLSGTRV